MDDHGRTAPLPNAEISSLPTGMRIIDDDRRWKRKNNSSGISTNNISTRHRSKSALPDPPQRDAWFSSCIWLYLQAKWMVKYTCCKHPQAQVWVMLTGDFRFLSNKVSPKACWNKKSLRAVQGDLGFLAPFLSAHRCSQKIRWTNWVEFFDIKASKF